MTKLKALHVVAMMVVGLGLQSCLNTSSRAPEITAPNGVVTVKTAADKTVFLQLDEKTTLLPDNMKKHPFNDKEVRAIVSYVENEQGEHAGYTKSVHINWIDAIPTKAMVPNAGKDNSKYGYDPVELVQDKVTGVEDGYITLRIRIFVGYSGAHTFDMVSGVNPNDPYEVELRHNAHSDFGDRIYDGYTAFRLKDVLPDTNGKTVKLTLKWESSRGMQSHTFEYKTPADAKVEPVV